MKIFKDIFNNDEVLSDIYPIKEIDDVIYEVEGKNITINESDNFDIGANPSADGQGEEEGTDSNSQTVINIVHAHRLAETSFDKKSYMGYIKAYMKRVLDHLKEKNPERVEIFQKNIQAFIKRVLEKFSDYSFYTGSSMDVEGLVILMGYREDGMTPVFYYVKDGLEGEKV